MLIEDENRAPLPRADERLDGMIRQADGTWKPGAILALWLELRKSVGVIAAKKKEGVKFKVRSAEDLVDKVREKANELGILVYPYRARGHGHVVEDGTLAEQELGVKVQAVEDGSILVLEGFGLGADNQDKAGGKAGTYAFKQALIQALLAGGKENAKALGVADTDDSDEPIEGGVRAKTRKRLPTNEEIADLFERASNEDEYRAAVKAIMEIPPARQVALKATVVAAKERLGLAPTPKTT